MKPHSHVAVRVAAAISVIVACAQSPSGPTVEQVKQDLVGQIFQYTKGGMDSWGHTVEPGGVESLAIQKRFTDKDAKTDELHAMVSLTDSFWRTRGVLIIGYKHFEQGWQLQSVRAEGAFSTEQLKTDLTPSVPAEIPKLEELSRELRNYVIGSLRAISSAQNTFASSCGDGFFAPDLAALTTGPRGPETAFLSADMKPKSGRYLDQKGYLIGIERIIDPSSPASCNGLPPGSLAKEFRAVAIPKAGNHGPAFEIGTDGIATER